MSKRKEVCEGGCDPVAFPVAQHDSEGIPLCVNCWTELVTSDLRARIARLERCVRAADSLLSRHAAPADGRDPTSSYARMRGDYDAARAEVGEIGGGDGKG